MKISSDYVDSVYWFSWINGAAPQNQDAYIDSAIITTDTPASRDAQGNPMIGPGNYTPPAQYCGDTSCNNGETCFSCAKDCGACSCVPNWSCSSWSACANNIQSRTCTDANNCNTTTGRPALTQSCTVTDPNATTITVDSTYPGYDQAKIDDGVMNASGMESGTWASGESSTNPHWIEFSFPQAKTINYVDIYWAYNPSRSAYMSSRELQVQYWNGSQYVTAGTIANTGSVEKSSLQFSQISTAKLRLYQPASRGYSGYPTVLWLTEVDYGVSNLITKPGDLNADNKVDVTDLGILLGNWNSSACPASCRGDLNRDGKVDVTDLGILLGGWGG